MQPHDYIGRRGILTGDTLPIPVTVTGATSAYGRVVLTVTHDGTTFARVNAERVTLKD